MLTQDNTPHTEKRRAANRAPRTPTSSQRLLTGTQIEQVYGIPYRSIYDLYLRKLLPAVRFTDGGRLWFRRADLEQLIERSTERMAG
jgi:hypothetical protein